MNTKDIQQILLFNIFFSRQIFILIQKNIKEYWFEKEKIKIKKEIKYWTIIENIDEKDKRFQELFDAFSYEHYLHFQTWEEKFEINYFQLSLNTSNKTKNKEFWYNFSLTQNFKLSYFKYFLLYNYINKILSNNILFKKWLLNINWKNIWFEKIKQYLWYYLLDFQKVYKMSVVSWYNVWYLFSWKTYSIFTEIEFLFSFIKKNISIFEKNEYFMYFLCLLYFEINVLFNILKFSFQNWTWLFTNDQLNSIFENKINFVNKDHLKDQLEIVFESDKMVNKYELYLKNIKKNLLEKLDYENFKKIENHYIYMQYNSIY